MSEFEQSITINSKPEKVFSLITEVEQLPKYFPIVRNVKMQTNERIQIEGEFLGHRFNQTGFFKTDKAARRVDFGAEGTELFSGWIRVIQGPDISASDLTAHLTLNITTEQREWLRSRFPNLDAMILGALKRALESFKNYCEGHGDPVNEADANAAA